MPVIPFIMICSGEYGVQLLKYRPNFTSFFVKIYVLVEIITFLVFHFEIQRGFIIRQDLIQRAPDLHSLWTNDVYNAPASLMHR